MFGEMEAAARRRAVGVGRSSAAAAGRVGARESIVGKRPHPSPWRVGAPAAQVREALAEAQPLAPLIISVMGTVT